MMTPDELKAWRKAHGLSQEALSRKLGVDRKTLQRWEWGYYPVPQYAENMLAMMGAMADAAVKALLH